MDPLDTTTSGAAKPATEKRKAPAAGTAAQAAQAARKPVVEGGAETAIEPGGPGAGAARVAKEAGGTVSRPQLGALADTLSTLPALSETDRSELDAYRRAMEENPDLKLALGERAELDMFRRLRGAPVGRVVDAADVSGTRIARAAAPIKRDGVLYAPGGEREQVPLDFAGYTELVQIGAITDTPWDELERADG